MCFLFDDIDAKVIYMYFFSIVGAFISMFVGVAVAIVSVWIVNAILVKRYAFMFKSGKYHVLSLSHNMKPLTKNRI